MVRRKMSSIVVLMSVINSAVLQQPDEGLLIEVATVPIAAVDCQVVLLPTDLVFKDRVEPLRCVELRIRGLRTMRTQRDHTGNEIPVIHFGVARHEWDALIEVAMTMQAKVFNPILAVQELTA